MAVTIIRHAPFSHQSLQWRIYAAVHGTERGDGKFACYDQRVGGWNTEHDSLEGSNIVLKRRVFTRVRPTHTPSSALRVGDDPTGKAARIASRWIVDHRISPRFNMWTGASSLRPIWHSIRVTSSTSPCLRRW
ncbi:hypothetical protein A0H81_03465 [Grifola frondosa]|uniref:Uncharacterized protein n=1 Tax=Grifola frondosa TaxID=5627 RepID=A0A1C7MJW3_GRIFR|nr:hypothetical protein A0H81_03465 [Grifola frondosa]